MHIYTRGIHNTDDGPSLSKVGTRVRPGNIQRKNTYYTKTIKETVVNCSKVVNRFREIKSGLQTKTEETHQL